MENTDVLRQAGLKHKGSGSRTDPARLAAQDLCQTDQPTVVHPLSVRWSKGKATRRRALKHTR